MSLCPIPRDPLSRPSTSATTGVCGSVLPGPSKTPSVSLEKEVFSSPPVMGRLQTRFRPRSVTGRGVGCVSG